MSSTAFITNQDTKKLKGRIFELIKTSQELKFLVGFFYFSGISELYEGLKERNDLDIKVLVGLDVDKYIHGLVEYGDETKDLTDEERVNNFFISIVKSINSDEFDTDIFYKQVKFFLGLIKDDKLIIRKTFKPNHSKLYIFKMKNEYKLLGKSRFVTGSSNLTKAGLMSQGEFNVEISDYGTEEAEQFFDEFWEDAVKVTEHVEFKKKLIDLVENKTLIAEVTPFEAFVFVLKNYLENQSQKDVKQSIKDLLVERKYKTYKYQLDAVRQALTIIEKDYGVIVSDVVGLGKSIVASMIAKSLGKRGIIICSPGLIGDENKKSGWKKYVEDFKLYDWEIRSLGIDSLEKTLELVRYNDDFEVIIVDEAHRFRNQDTEGYELLSNICKNKIVILLSATPFNNTPSDIFSLLKLFIIPGKSKITLGNDLDIKFKIYEKEFKILSYISKNYNSFEPEKKARAIAYYESLFESSVIDLKKLKERTKYLSNKIRAVIEPVVIRRNRIDLKKDPEYSKEVYDLSEVKDPEESFFSLTQEQSKFYDKVITDYFGDNGRFKGAIYQPHNYEKDIKNKDAENNDENKLEANREYWSQRNLYDFMKRLLVKRFESSFGSFQQSITNFLKMTEIATEFIKSSGGQFILDRKLIEQIYLWDEDEIEKELNIFAEKLKDTNRQFPKNYKIYDVNSFKRKDQFLADLESDINLFNTILDELAELKIVEKDPKLDKLINEIKDVLNETRKNNEPIRKVIVFSEYLDTIRHIEPALEKEFEGKLLTVKGDLTSSLLDKILENFDASYEVQKDDYNILISTDKISEGFNLNRAGVIINYDIPWNPTRVIQRVGRINRISKKVFSELYIINFFPTEKGANIVKSRQIATEKMFLIHNTLGEDTKIFEIDEIPTAANLFKKVMQNPEQLEGETFQTKIRQKFFAIKEKFPDIVNKCTGLPSRIKVAKKFNSKNVLVFTRKGLGFFIRVIVNKSDNIEEFSLDEAYEFIECDPSEPLLPLSDTFWEKYEKIKSHKEQFRKPTSEQSVERKAINNLNYLIKAKITQLEKYLPFLRTLREDLMEYKTLSDYTLRRIAALKASDKEGKNIDFVISELEQLRIELGADYLERIKNKLGNISSEIIVAVENI